MMPIPDLPGFNLVQIDAQNPSDVARVLEVYRQCEDFLALGPQPRASLEMVQDDLAASAAAGGVFCGILAADGQLAGIFDLIPSGFRGDPRQACLALIMLALPHRSRGLGQRLLNALEAWLKPRGIHTFTAHVQVNNPASLSFFQAQGFQIISEPALQPDGTTSVELRKQLHKDS